ncbi:NERD domain-containing protein [Trichocoleus sp. FACHB-591]|uniref:nuclease-related domain-containing protein n=1 Tax=Trichocoleus sp. FACHB-591 TaxID=2692872 RepID=UPI0016871ACC|nr:nuclease-related domain-containing protein [Trichocoleus sp. FACHB-591]MBD2096890.1 NERD domain-containing protein [Trichocoleus sp. FACHB-591]
MIVKELDAFVSQNKFAKAGRIAEEQMAFYLRRAFSDEQKLYVFNDLRLEQGDDAAQIDHLILHRHGVVIIESKSVSKQVEVNQHGEWIRWFNGTPQGMPSPIQQARRQADFLKKYLNDHADRLRGKILGLQTYFGGMGLDVLVAISDSGMIKRSEGMSLEEISKADQVVERVQAIVEKYRKANSLFSLNLKDAGYWFNDEELSKVADFLVQHHRPLGQPISEPPLVETPKLKISQLASPTQAATSIPKLRLSPQPKEVVASQAQSCQHCHSSSLSVEYGKYGYYLKCSECSGNNSIKAVCPACNAKAKIRKCGKQFFAECASCETSTLFHTNP